MNVFSSSWIGICAPKILRLRHGLHVLRPGSKEFSLLYKITKEKITTTHPYRIAVYCYEAQPETVHERNDSDTAYFSPRYVFSADTSYPHRCTAASCSTSSYARQVGSRNYPIYNPAPLTSIPYHCRPASELSVSTSLHLLPLHPTLLP